MASWGDGTTTERHVPTPVPGLADVVALALGTNHSCALLLGGSVNVWGFNKWGELGDGTTADHHTPEPVPGLSGVS